MFNQKLLSLCLTLLLVVAFSMTGLAQSSGRNLGLGDDFVTITGADAIYGNPAAVNLTPDRFTLELSGAAKGWNNLLTNDYISESDKDDLLDNDLLGGVNGNQGAKLIFGPVALVTEVRQSALVNLPPDVVELLLAGNEIGKTYDLSGTNGSGAVYGAGALNFSTQASDNVVNDWGFDNVHMGFTYQQLGGVIFEVDGTGETTIGYDAETGDPIANGNGEFRLKYNEDKVAQGSALDLGVYAQVNDKYNVGISILNLGSLAVDGYHYQNYEYDTTDDFSESTEGDSDEQLKWELPSTIRIGGQMDYSESIDIYADYSNTSYHGEQVNHKFATASELTWLNWLPLRTGLSYSTLEKQLNWSAGFGLYLGPLQADLGVSNLLGLYNQSKGGQAALTTKIEF
jgi:hypothetical protein